MSNNLYSRCIVGAQRNLKIKFGYLCLIAGTLFALFIKLSPIGTYLIGALISLGYIFAVSAVSLVLKKIKLFKFFRKSFEGRAWPRMTQLQVLWIVKLIILCAIYPFLVGLLSISGNWSDVTLSAIRYVSIAVTLLLIAPWIMASSIPAKDELDIKAEALSLMNYEFNQSL